ncbi:hypothetical protein Moror_15428 [Moniliophthora roreri MCA 2997]|uniref:Uncharacterized protein n=1 Tax=Moniliophthora roreri (strain MCA 2997) TaxID=1381753 RepID=V2WJX4_MONRO|nr:hypothetical protein Moror_15428 [Moniliophthora roreri MCA 2997]
MPFNTSAVPPSNLFFASSGHSQAISAAQLQMYMEAINHALLEMQIEAGFIEKGSSGEDHFLLPNIYDDQVLSHSPTPLPMPSSAPLRKCSSNKCKAPVTFAEDNKVEEVVLPPVDDASSSEFEPSSKMPRVEHTYTMQFGVVTPIQLGSAIDSYETCLHISSVITYMFH